MNRNRKIDVVKGIGIILIVLGHSGLKQTNFIYLFHVAIFVIASGYLYNNVCAVSLQNLKKLYIKKIKNFYLPYVVWNVIFLSLTNIFILLNIYTNNTEFINGVEAGYNSLHNQINLYEWVVGTIKILLFTGNQQLFGASWFLRVLFFVTVIYATVDYLSNKISKRYNIYFMGFFSFLTLIVGYYLQINNIILKLSLPTVLSSIILFFLGTQIKKINLNKIQSVISIIVSITLLIYFNFIGKVSLNENVYTNPLFLVLASISGWIVVSKFAECILKIKSGSFIAYIGKNSMSVLILHFLSFKLVSVFIVLMKGLPRYKLASFPVIDISGVWWVIYTIVGVLLPVFLTYLSQLIFAKIKKSRA